MSDCIDRIATLHCLAGSIERAHKEEIQSLQTENAALVEDLKEISLGQQPIDYGKWKVTVERLQGIAQQALEKIK